MDLAKMGKRCSLLGVLWNPAPPHIRSRARLLRPQPRAIGNASRCAEALTPRSPTDPPRSSDG